MTSRRSFLQSLAAGIAVLVAPGAAKPSPRVGGGLGNPIVGMDLAPANSVSATISFNANDLKTGWHHYLMIMEDGVTRRYIDDVKSPPDAVWPFDVDVQPDQKTIAINPNVEPDGNAFIDQLRIDLHDEDEKLISYDSDNEPLAYFRDRG